jgi:hypothetical protein
LIDESIFFGSTTRVAPKRAVFAERGALRSSQGRDSSLLDDHGRAADPADALNVH